VLPDGMHVFKPKNANLGKFRHVLQCKMFVNFIAISLFLLSLGLFMAIGYILRSFGIFFPFWYVVPRKIWQPWSVYMKHEFRIA
jgi:hypothetical protein